MPPTQYSELPLSGTSLDIFPIRPAGYLARREAFSFLRTLRSPYNLMIVGSVLMVFVMPKLKDLLGLEELQNEYTKMQEEKAQQQRPREGSTRAIRSGPTQSGSRRG